MSNNVDSISPVTAEHLNALRVLDSEITLSIEKAKDAGLPQGLLVSILHSHSTIQTLVMAGYDQP